MGLLNGFLKPGKGVKKSDVTKKFGFKRFFVTFGDKFWKLVTLNLLFFLVNVPIFFIFAYLARVGGVPYQTPVNVLFQPLYGVLLHGENQALNALYGVVGIQIQHNYPSTLTNVFLIVGLLSLLTFGLGSAAMTYVQRNFVKGEPVDTAEDFFGSIKKNWKQTILLGLVDLMLLFVIAFDVVSYIYVDQSFGFLVLLYLTLVLSAIYLMMRPYLYLMSVTFDINIGKMIKNAWILAISGLGRNILGGICALAILFLNVIVFNFIPSLGVGMFFIFTISLAWFFQVYAAWPIVKKFMIDPFYEEKNIEPEEEAVFEDRG